MSKFAAILYDSLLEVRDRKISYLYWGVAVVVALAIAFIPNFKINNVDLLESGMVSPEIFQKATATFFDGLIGFMIFLMVFGSAGLIPSFLGRGRVELTLSKPIDRYRLLAMKFASIYIIMCAILTITMTIIWLVLSIRFGVFSWHFFAGLAYAYVQFFAVYCIVFLLGVASHSTVVGIMGYFIIRVATDLLAGRKVVYELLGDSVWKKILDGLYHILPKIGEMSANYAPLMEGKGLDQTYPLYSTLGISVVLFLLALLIFSRRDY